MFLHKNFVWKLYALFYIFLLTRETFELFHPDSPEYLFYFILESFDSHFYITHGLAVLRLLFDGIQFFALIGFIYQKPIFFARLWQIIFILRVIFDFAADYYSLLELTSYFQMDVQIGFYVAAAWIGPYIPSYIAGFCYAFYWRKYFSAKIKNPAPYGAGLN